ncbi:hypothetical protein [Chitinilyticum piscinae]|uniref:Solute-binding protein family 3/N-terminal domain-containing protein n=1 Tax=Chitinilyticum piscinae TaxID=2866724 RepID=A0A8J7FNM4_9NEIS|nr:hypothetical protein [Chitinilyticum piscinae]MBE9610111.1 hypothetical protein [Chitinilyticum piscinae]
MRKICCLLLAWLALAMNSLAAIEVAVPNDVLRDYLRLVPAGRDIDAIRDYSGEGARRDTVELILFQQALRLGGVSDEIRFVPVDSYQRNLVEVEQARLLATATSVWASDVKTSPARLSEPLIREGEYVVGFYTLAGNSKVENATIDELRQLTAITNKAWKTDVATLESLGISRIISATTFPLIARMLNGGRADFTMISFKPTPDMAFEVEGIRLVPVQGIKVAMPGSRHFLVAPGAEGDRVLLALNKGLNQLRREGRIRRAYSDGGFFNRRVENWRLLNPSLYRP